MALESTDLFVVQSQSDSNFYKLRLDSLIAEVQASGGINFRGTADLNNPPSSSGITLPALSGDLYLVESDAAVIDSGWVMKEGETSASIGDRVIYAADTLNWILVTAPTSEVGTVTDITATLPLECDGDTVNPVISVLEARTTTAAGTAADGKGTDGVVHRLAEIADVNAGSGTGDTRAVVTADLLKATNSDIAGLVKSVSTNDVNSNAALNVTTTDGDVVVEISTASDLAYGVVQIADAADLTNGTSGPSAVVDAEQLKAVNDAAIKSVTTNDANSNSALSLNNTDGNVVIEINTASDSAYGVVSLADSTDISNGTSGPSAVVDAAQLKAVASAVPPSHDGLYVKLVDGGVNQSITGTGGLTSDGPIQATDLITTNVKSSVFLGTDASGKIISSSAPAVPGDGGLTIQSYGENADSQGTFTANQTTGSTITLPQIRYGDLSGLPTIPTVPTVGDGGLTIQSYGENADSQGTFTANQTAGSTITLPQIRYQDLSGKPTIPSVPTVGDGGLTIQSYGENANAQGTFTANQTAGSTLTLPQIRYADISGKPTIPTLGNYANTSLYTFDASGNFTATGDVTAFSDINLKENIEIIPDALNKVSQIRGVTFERKNTEDNQRHSGVIAQEVEAVIPEVVHTNEDGIKSVAYGNLVGLLIESIKELKAEVEELKKERN